MERTTDLRRVVRLGLTLAGLMLLLAGCAEDTSAEVSTELVVTGTDGLEFQPADFVVPAGEEITVRMTAGEAVNHDFTIEGVAAGEEDLLVLEVDPAETATGNFVIEEPGVFQVFCGVPGHREAGMVAILTVVEGG